VPRPTRSDRSRAIVSVGNGPASRRVTRPNAPNSVIASAARITADKPKLPRGGIIAPWQREVIEFADTVGELAFVQQWTANALSRVTLTVAEQIVDDQGRPGVRPSDNAAAHAALDALFYGEVGQSEMMSQFGHHLHTPGESWLVGVPPQEGESADDDLWRVLSILELQQQGSRWTIDRGDGNPETYEDGSRPDKPAEAIFLRIWRPHPMRWVEATSPIRAAIPILRELQGLTETIASNIDSRLTGAGILLVPSEMTFGTPLDAAADPADVAGQRDFIKALAESFAVARRDLSSAAAQVPIILRVPGNLIDKVQHIRLSSDLNTQAMELRTEAIRRFSLTADAPPEVLLGNADSNHWSAWLSDDQGIKDHIEPLTKPITTGLTTQYLWPAMGDVEQDPSLRRFLLIPDTSDLRNRPNHGEDAKALWADFRISNAALLRETGFEEGDVPSADEVRARLVLLAAMGKIDPGLAQSGLAQLGVKLEGEPTISMRGDLPPGTPPQATEQTTPIEEPVAQTHNPPAPEQAAALQASAELLVLRALERANARLNRRGKTRKPVTDEAAITAALGDAWSQIPRTAALLGVDAERLRTYCEDYVRKLLHTGDDHTPTALSASLAPLLELAQRQEAGG
jgi:hypothetical protein